MIYLEITNFYNKCYWKQYYTRTMNPIVTTPINTIVVQTNDRITFKQFFGHYKNNAAIRTRLEFFFKSISRCCCFLRERLDVERGTDVLSGTPSASPQTMIALSMFVTLIYEVIDLSKLLNSQLAFVVSLTCRSEGFAKLKSFCLVQEFPGVVDVIDECLRRN